MLRRHLMSGTAAAGAALLATTVLAQAQNGATASQSTSPKTPAARANARMTLEGCLVRARDVPGRSPNVPNPAGAAEGFALISRPTTSPVGTAGAGAPGAVSGSGNPTGNGSDSRAGSATATERLGPIYTLHGLSPDTLNTLAGKYVEVSGSLDRAASFDKAADHDREETPQGNARSVGSGSQTQTGTDANAGRGDEKDHWLVFMATSIRETSGSCPSR